MLSSQTITHVTNKKRNEKFRVIHTSKIESLGICNQEALLLNCPGQELTNGITTKRK